MQFGKQESAVRERAYALWEQEGRPDGREWDHWERASHEITSRFGLEMPAIPQKAKPAVRKGAKTRIREALKSAIAS